MLRAYDKNTGKQVGAVWMPAPQSGSPMTYSMDGRQYIIVARQRRQLLGRVHRVQASEQRTSRYCRPAVRNYQLSAISLATLSWLLIRWKPELRRTIPT